MKNIVKWTNPGCLGYDETTRIQEELRSRIINANNSETGYLLILEHKPVITVGKFGNESNLLISETQLRQRGIEIFRTSRGGNYTYHGPGQLVCYPIFNLRKMGLGVKKYVHNLEELIIKVLSIYGINSGRRDSYPGVWTENKKIAFIGINIRRHVSMHGFSLNYDVDIENYSYINPCGIDGLEVTSISNHYGGKLKTDDLINVVVSEFINTFDCELLEDRSLISGLRT